LWPAIIGGVAGLATGAVSALGAPWAKWGVDKRHMKLERQYELLDSWRAGITTMSPTDLNSALSTDWFERLRPFLSKDLREEIDVPRKISVAPDTSRGFKDKLAAEVDRIEREWGLRPQK
jgi:hypothetical protein